MSIIYCLFKVNNVAAFWQKARAASFKVAGALLDLGESDVGKLVNAFIFSGSNQL
ncbi:hypothetical protein ACFCVU_14925 [Peribacillus butanolivorans]|uniref:hypothetical protein n=1 Tax=Peribacillus butanolivorans TaxID=421767 RepID=UPI0035D66096